MPPGSTSEDDTNRSDSTTDDEETSSVSSHGNTRPSGAVEGTVPNGVVGARLDSNAVEANNTNSASPTGSSGTGGRVLSNNPMDERVEVRDGDNIATPRALQAPQHRSSSSDDEEESDSADRAGTAGDRRVVHNAPHDEAIPVTEDSDGEEHVATPVVTHNLPPQRQQQRTAPTASAMVPDDDDDDDDDAEEEEEEEEEAEEAEASNQRSEQPQRQQYRQSYGGQVPAAIEQPTGDSQATQSPTLPNREYNPAKYARVNAKASREMQDLFKHILDYQAFTAELPAKLRPFIPDYIPAVGDLDPFVKVPRPDGLPDGLGLYVVDEPAIPQSNPAVVQLELRATNAHVAGGAAQVVDSFEDAANRPEVIDRWINDVKKVHYKKPLPTVVYQKPMPDIDTLLQAWPQAFEEVLNSDVQFPSSNIDLDINQYVRTLCALLDIPTHTSLIDSLHVMFTLYEEFRVNQHFQHE